MVIKRFRFPREFHGCSGEFFVENIPERFYGERGDFVENENVRTKIIQALYSTFTYLLFNNLAYTGGGWGKGWAILAPALITTTGRRRTFYTLVRTDHDFYFGEKFVENLLGFGNAVVSSLPALVKIVFRAADVLLTPKMFPIVVKHCSRVYNRKVGSDSVAGDVALFPKLLVRHRRSVQTGID